jgi:hypothetical protein
MRRDDKRRHAHSLLRGGCDGLRFLLLPFDGRFSFLRFALLHASVLLLIHTEAALSLFRM